MLSANKSEKDVEPKGYKGMSYEEELRRNKEETSGAELCQAHAQFLAVWCVLTLFGCMIFHFYYILNIRTSKENKNFLKKFFD